MSGGFSIGGLISGLDSNTLISQMMAIERQPEIRIKQRITNLQSQQDAVRKLRTQLLALRSRIQDFRLGMVFDQYKAASSEDTVLTADVSGGTPVLGSYTVDVTRLASATVATSSASIGAAIHPDVALNSSGLNTQVTGTKFSINGVQFTFNPNTQSLNDIIGLINGSAAGVTATYDAATDKMTLANTAAGDTALINLGASSDDSNLLQVLNLTQATQATNGSGSTVVSSTRNLGAVDAGHSMSGVSFRGGAVTAGTFSINGVSFTVDPSEDSLADILGRINNSGAQVAASYDSATDTIRVVSKVTGSRTIRFTSGTSNFLDMTDLSAATQTAGNDAQFSINGGASQTRNSNQISDAIGGVTLDLLSTGTSTVTISADNDAVIQKIQDFLDDFNASISQIHDLTKTGGTAEGDSSLRMIQGFLQSGIFSQVKDIAGDNVSLAEIGITTGSTFDASAVPKLELDKDAFLAALSKDSANVEGLFSNVGKTGVADGLFTYLDKITSTTGFLNDRVKANGSIDRQIQDFNDQIARIEDRVTQKTARLKTQFGQLEQLVASYQSQGSSLSVLSSTLGSL